MIAGNEVKNVINFVRKNNIKYVRVIFPDLNGKMRGKIVPVKIFIKGLREGFQFDEENLSQNVNGINQYVPGITSGVESNMFAFPDLKTLTLIPWKKNYAQVIVNLFTKEGEVYIRNPRYVLQSIIDKFLKDGMVARIGAELEFYIFRDSKPATKTADCYSLPALNEIEDFVRKVFDYSKLMNIEIDALHHSTDHGQIEVSLEHKKVLKAADDLLYFKDLLVEIGKILGYKVVLMPKISKERSSSGNHLHLSIWNKEGKNNLFIDENNNETTFMKSVIGGLLNHLDAASAFYLPTINSHKRLSKGNWTPINKSYGHENRFCAFRISHKNDKSKNIENRVCGADINPYLAIAAYLVSAYSGIINKTNPPDETIGNPYHDKKLQPLPRDILDSLEKLNKDNKFKSMFGDEFVRLFTAVRKSDFLDYFHTISEWELTRYM